VHPNRPPDLRTLRSLVRGELAPAERSAVDSWLVRCVDPDLPTVLQNLVVEWENERADQALPAAMRGISAVFAGLLDEGRAFIDRLSTPTLAAPAFSLLASAPRPKRRRDEGLELLCASGSRQVKLEVWVGPACTYAAVVVQNDLGAVHVLLATELEPSSVVRSVRVPSDYIVEPAEERVTFWLVVADHDALPTPPSAAEPFVDWLRRAKATDGCRAYARRVTPSAFEEP